MMQNTPDWVLRLRALSDQPPLRERAPLTWGGIEIGDAEPAVLQQIERAFSFNERRSYAKSHMQTAGALMAT